MSDVEEAKDKVMMGAERRSMVMSEDEKKLTAYHEGGHAIVALNEKASDPIHKATIIPRGRALGMVMRVTRKRSVICNKRKNVFRYSCGNGWKDSRRNNFWS